MAGSSTGTPPGMDGLTDDVRIAMDLDADERIERVALAVGCTLVLTERRLMLIRDGASFRPKTGVQSWAVGRDLKLHLSRVRHDTGRLLILHEQRSVSVFLTMTQRPGVDALIADVRKRAYTDA